MSAKLKSAAVLAAVLMDESHEHSGKCEIQNPSPEMIAVDAIALLRIGAGLKRWAERACNGIERYQGNGIWCGMWTERDEAAKDRADARYAAKATEIAARYGATVQIDGDPRGYVLRLILASGRTNGFGAGWGIA